MDDADIAAGDCGGSAECCVFCGHGIAADIASYSGRSISGEIVPGLAELRAFISCKTDEPLGISNGSS